MNEDQARELVKAVRYVGAAIHSVGFLLLVGMWTVAMCGRGT